MDSGVAVSVRDIDLVLGRKGHMGTAIEGLSALEWGRLSRDSKHQEDLPIQGALADRVIPIIGTVYGVVRTHGNSVGSRNNTFTP